MKKYYSVYDFTNENIACLDFIYDFKDAKVLSVVGSGDQYFASILYGAKQVDLFDINPTSYLYFLLKFYSIRELSYEEFCDFLVIKNLQNLNVYEKLIKVLPKDVLKYYKYILLNSKNKKLIFKRDGIDLSNKKSKKYYFNQSYYIIPYFDKKNYYKLQELLKKQNIPKYYELNFIDIKDKIKDNYDIALLSNIYNYLSINISEYAEIVENLNIPQIQILYDWYGLHMDEFNCLKWRTDNKIQHLKYSLDIVKPSAPNEFVSKRNFVFSLKKQKQK